MTQNENIFEATKWSRHIVNSLIKREEWTTADHKLYIEIAREILKHLKQWKLNEENKQNRLE